MAVKWSVGTLNYKFLKDGKSNVVTSVDWFARDSKEVTRDGKKITYSNRRYGSAGLSTSDLSSFVAYNKIDEDTAVSWVKKSLGDDTVKSIEDSISNQIETQENSTEGKGKPW